jgi:hypothetical protein
VAAASFSAAAAATAVAFDGVNRDYFFPGDLNSGVRRDAHNTKLRARFRAMSCEVRALSVTISAILQIFVATDEHYI